MKGLIIDNNDMISANVKSLFNLMDGEELEYNWFIICEDIAYLKYKNIGIFNQEEYCFLTGEELARSLKADDALWVWGVLSAIPKDVPLEEILKYEYPYSRDNGEIWGNPITMQHPHAVIEIVPWDGMLTLVISSDDKLVERIHQKVPNAVDLYEDNIRVEAWHKEQEEKNTSKE